MKTFEILDISGDVGIKAYGKSIEDVFVNAAAGMYSLITDIEGINESRKIIVEVKGDSPEGLLAGYLNELIFQFDAYGFIGRSIEMNIFRMEPAPFLKATIRGEEFDTERHESKLLIKAATYHKLKIEKVHDIWEVNVIFDI